MQIQFNPKEFDSMPDHDKAAYEDMKAQSVREPHNYPEMAARELTVGELLDRRIHKAEQMLKALHDLKQSLPGQYLNSGASRISAFIEL
jgi:hypothetical protein